MDNDRTYNGWTNYETWAVALWLDNDQGSYAYWREQAEEHWKNAPACEQVQREIWTREEAAKFNLADQIREEIRENMPLQEASMYSDLLTSALDEVNWQEIAGNWLEDWIEAVEKATTEQTEQQEPGELPVIFSYTRAQAIADGVLIDVSEAAKEAGIAYPTALTVAIWERHVKTLGKGNPKKEKAWLQDFLKLYHTASKFHNPGTDTFTCDSLIVIDDKLKIVRIKSVGGPGDSAEPVITIMLPEED